MPSSVLNSGADSLQSISEFADIPMEIEVELDRRSLLVRDLLDLAPGRVISLTRAAGENVDVRVNGTRLGLGEIVILENRIGVRITDFETD
jgi:flagellar motor switch protein FliN/FliY